MPSRPPCWRPLPEARGAKDIGSPEKKEETDSTGAKFTRIQLRATMPGNSHPEIFEVTANGSGKAFSARCSGRTADVGMASRRINDKETGELQPVGDMRSPASEIVLGLDGIAIVVNRANPVARLTRKEIAALFSGKVANWGALGGRAMPVTLYGRNSDSGTYDSFVAMVFGGKKDFAAGLTVKENGEAIAEAVASDPGGIGYVGLPQIGPAKAVAVSDGGNTTPLMPSPFTVATEDYVLSRRLYLYLPQQASSLARRFASFAQSAEGQAVVKKIKFVEQTGEFEEFSEVPIPASAPLAYKEVVYGKRRSKLDFRFEPGSDDLDTKALADVDRVVNALSGANVKDVYLLGFADNRGSFEENLKLSENRARVVGG